MGGRGLKHSREARLHILALITEAVNAGARQAKACEQIGISERTIERWKAQDIGEDQRQGPHAGPANKLSEQERAAVLQTLNSAAYRDLSPAQIVPKLADQGEYQASEATMYRILREEKMNKHRQQSKPAQQHKPKAHVASAPDQVWSWDITYLATRIKGVYYYLYMILDVFSRKVVGWEVHDRECQIRSAMLLQKTVGEAKSAPGLVLHSDNGGAMRGATMLAKMQALGVVPSYSRPGVSDDNAFSEALFKTLKYRAWYPEKGFEDVTEARRWVDGFVDWYNEKHCHSGIGYVTPQQRYRGEDVEILNKRREVYEQAKAAKPQRWAGEVRSWERPEEVVLNPDGKTETKKDKQRQRRARAASASKVSGEQVKAPLADLERKRRMEPTAATSLQAPTQAPHAPSSRLPLLSAAS